MSFAQEGRENRKCYGTLTELYSFNKDLIFCMSFVLLLQHCMHSPVVQAFQYSDISAITYVQI